MTTRVRQRMVGSGALLLLALSVGLSVPVAGEETGMDASSQQITASQNLDPASRQAPDPNVPSLPLLFAEGSNSCEIVSCGMGIKQTCQITCPVGKTPKCSCDCERNIGPLCMDYKANCRCD
ncbi:MAG: hypothetical protein M3M98_07655 [Nitrospirota bacterium]|nr:hypothetical protein [Nitrospirota bacterium]